MAEIRFCYDYNADQLKAISDAWDDAIEYLTDEVAREVLRHTTARELPRHHTRRPHYGYPKNHHW
jgi:hypothetical protein